MHWKLGGDEKESQSSVERMPFKSSMALLSWMWSVNRCGFWRRTDASWNAHFRATVTQGEGSLPGMWSTLQFSTSRNPGQAGHSNMTDQGWLYPAPPAHFYIIHIKINPDAIGCNRTQTHLHIGILNRLSSIRGSRSRHRSNHHVG